MTITPIILLEDRGILGLSISDYLLQAKTVLEPYGLQGRVQLLASRRALKKWLDSQPIGAVRLLLLDFSVADGTSVMILSQLRDPVSGCFLHPALHPDALVIGWSAEPTSAPAFQSAHADGFISKHRPVTQIVDDIVTIAQRHRSGDAWIALLE